jgi:hypothetical protein
MLMSESAETHYQKLGVVYLLISWSLLTRRLLCKLGLKNLKMPSSITPQDKIPIVHIPSLSNQKRVS